MNHPPFWQPTSKMQSRLLLIPSEMRDEIMKHCDHKTLKNLGKTNRDLRHEVNEHARRRCMKEYPKSAQRVRKSKRGTPRNWIVTYSKFNSTLCVACESTTISRKNLTTPVWCRRCLDTCRPKVTKQDAKTKYLLDEADLATLRCIKVHNLNYFRAPKIHLYEPEQVMEKAHDKYGGPTGLAAALTAAHQRKIAFGEARQNAKNARREKLKVLLELNGIPFQTTFNVSANCQLFVESGRYSIQTIATYAKRDHIVRMHTYDDSISSFDGHMPYWNRYARRGSAYYEALLNDEAHTPCPSCGEPVFESLKMSLEPRFGYFFSLPVKVVHAHDGMTDRARSIARNRDIATHARYERQLEVDKILNAQVECSKRLQQLRRHPKVLSFISDGGQPVAELLGELQLS